MRRSISRTSSRYAFRRCRSLGPRFFCSRVTSCEIQSRMLRFTFLRARPAPRALPPSPNRFSNAMRGSSVMGSGCGRRRPTDGVRVHAGVAVIAGARGVHHFDAELDRRQRRILAELLRVELVDRRADEIIRAFGHLGMRRGQIHRARAEMIGAFLGRRPGGGRMQVRVADDGDVIAEGPSSGSSVWLKSKSGPSFSGDQ